MMMFGNPFDWGHGGGLSGMFEFMAQMMRWMWDFMFGWL